MEKILVPIDFSDTSIKALMYGAEIASKSNAVIYLLHVVQPPPVSYSDIPLPNAYLNEVQLSDAYERMEKLKKDVLLTKPNLGLSYIVLEGDVVSTITDFVTVKDCDLIVMGTHGTTGFKGLIWGSVTAKTLTLSPVPVIAVPNDYLLSEPLKILLATNRFEENPALIEPVFQIAKIFNAAVNVMVFIDKDNASAVEYLEAGRNIDKYRNLLQKRYPGTLIKSELIDGSDFGNALALYEGREEIDLIAMITYPKDIFEKLARKTITKKITMHSRIPVLAIPAKTTIAKREATKADV